MGDSFTEDIEDKLLIQRKNSNNAELMFHTGGSRGTNPLKLAQICVVWDYTMNLLGWDKKPMAKFSFFLTQYQASLDAKYHNDYKAVLIAEEIERKRAERKGVSILSQ